MADYAIDMDVDISGSKTLPDPDTDTDYALVSGGKASAVAAHAAIEHGPAKVAVHLDTRTGLDRNQEYIEELAETFGWTLMTLRTRVSWEDEVEQVGMPGPQHHGKMFNILKRRPLERLKVISQGEVGLWTGVYRKESQNRMGYVEPIDEGDRWIWVSPLHDWDPADFDRYVEAAGIPENPIWTELGRSGDCFCGAYANREELIDLEAAGYGDHADYIRSVEDRIDIGNEKEIWGWASLSDVERRGERMERDTGQMKLCSSCNPQYPVAEGGGSSE